jgi:hypothetical protein
LQEELASLQDLYDSESAQWTNHLDEAKQRTSPHPIHPFINSFIRACIPSGIHELTVENRELRERISEQEFRQQTIDELKQEVALIH